MIGYATTEELIQYAAARGVTLSQAPEVLLTLALDYIESLEPLLDGERVDPAQHYSWPRTLTAGVPLA
ncbi:MAG: DnaT-like ssDNA-binding protein, partial [Plesiomonas sp.]